MGEINQSNDVVLLLDNYGPESQNLHTSFQLAGKDYPVVVLEDDGFLPEGVQSVIGYFLGDFPTGKGIPGKPRYFNQIQVPEYWEISASNSGGKIHDLSKLRGKIFYTQPHHKRLVKVVDWYDEAGTVRSSDHYNKYGALYARTIFNNKGQRVNRSYFSADGKEILMENYVTKDWILNEDNQVRVFHTKLDLILYFMKKSGFDKKRIFFNTLSTSFFVSQSLPNDRKEDVLFWQETMRPDVPGNMQAIIQGTANRATKIMVQKKASYEKFLELGVPAEIISKLGYIYPFKKSNTHKPEVLICTNSDRIEKCQEIVEALPEVHFCIAALTEMSSKLMSMDQYDNVSLYPGVKMHILDELFESCDFYLDINHESEIVNAVNKAFLHNHLIFAFEETIHNREYIAPEHIYKASDMEKMVQDIKCMLLDGEKVEAHLEIQRQWAMSEREGSYNIL